uniref:LptE family protein n=1 Tax=uncultured Dysgonomonas sp. TaxID=206096 RepID=UPI002607BAB1|nr:LptE family protein [uncultured Dysgonomonas sp.]
MRKLISCLVILLIVVSCRISYQFNGASIDYSKVKTIQIKDFQNQARLVYPPLSQMFSEHMRDVFLRNTKLQLVNNGRADLEIEGEIIGYDLMALAVQEGQFASQTRLTMTVRMRFRNNVNPQEDKEETFSAYQNFNSNEILDNIQAQLVEELNKEIVDQIFNATMANW